MLSEYFPPSDVIERLTDVVCVEPPPKSAQASHLSLDMTTNLSTVNLVSHATGDHDVTHSADGGSGDEPTEGVAMEPQHVDVASLARRGRLFAKRHSNRLVQKSGEFNVISVGVPKRKLKYVADLFTTLIEMRWRYLILLYVAQFVVSWSLFGVAYYAIAVERGDILHKSNASWIPCVSNVNDYTSAFLYSFETQSTIGYGTRVIDPSCSLGVLIVLFQNWFGTILMVFASGVVFVKISRPKGRAKTILFSRNAVICQRDGQYQLVFRVADMRTKSHVIGTSIRALMVRNRLTTEGELVPLCQYPLVIDNETSPAGDMFLFMAWPVTIVHKIDESSPLWDISAQQLITEKFEIIVILEGTIESTGSLTQIRTSYLPSEILWGHRLAPLVTFPVGNGGRCTIDYHRFHDTLPIPTSEYSARTWTFRRRSESSDRLHAFDTLHDDFTLALVREHETALRRIINRLSHHRIAAADSRNELQLERHPYAGRKGNMVWTVADPCRPVSTMGRRPSVIQL
jgi:potassium inwardly-rectifying channel subfamily J